AAIFLALRFVERTPFAHARGQHIARQRFAEEQVQQEWDAGEVAARLAREPRAECGAPARGQLVDAPRPRARLRGRDEARVFERAQLAVDLAAGDVPEAADRAVDDHLKVV